MTNGLPDNERAGATALAMHPDDPAILFVGLYERLRTPWNMHSGGPGAYLSVDGGETWTFKHRHNSRTMYTIDESPMNSAGRVGRDRRRQCASDAQWGCFLDKRPPQHSRCSGSDSGEQSRGIPLCGGNRVRNLRRALAR